MLFLRSLIYAIFLMITVIPWGLMSVALSIFVRGVKLYKFAMMWTAAAVWGAKWICGVTWRVRGEENLPAGAVILCPKHQSAWETLFLPVYMPKPLCFVFKKELLMIPFFGWAIGKLNMIHIDRKQKTKAWNKVAAQGKAFMEQDHWVILFPEGTRTARGQQGTYKKGASRLAVATQVPIVPIAITSGRCWPRHVFVKKPGVIDVSIGQPIAVEGKNEDELMLEVEQWIEAEMRRLDPEAYLDTAVKQVNAAASSTTGAEASQTVRSL